MIIAIQSLDTAGKAAWQCCSTCTNYYKVLDLREWFAIQTSSVNGSDLQLYIVDALEYLAAVVHIFNGSCWWCTLRCLVDVSIMKGRIRISIIVPRAYFHDPMVSEHRLRPSSPGSSC